MTIEPEPMKTTTTKPAPERLKRIFSGKGLNRLKADPIRIKRKTLKSGQDAFLDIEEPEPAVILKKTFQDFVISETSRGATLSMFHNLEIPARTVENWRYGHRMPAAWVMKMLIGRD